MEPSKPSTGLSTDQVLPNPRSSSPTLVPPTPASRSPDHRPSSRGSTKSSPYLSPSLTGSDSDLPPYKPGMDDQMSLSMRTKRKNTSKVKRKKDLVQHRAAEQADHTSIQSTLPAYTNPQRSPDEDATEMFDEPSFRVRQLSSTSSQVHSWNAEDPKKAIATRKSHGERRWSFAENRMLLNPSPTTTCIANLPEDNISFWSNISIRDFGLSTYAPAIDKEPRNPDHSEQGHQYMRRKDLQLETPAIITLRKASKAHSSGRQPGNPRWPSQDERTRSIIAQSQRCGEALDDSQLVLDQQSTGKFSTQNDTSISSAGVSRSRPSLPSLMECTYWPSVARASVAAEPALTFAQICTTGPRRFSSSAASRKHSLLAREIMRRSSTVLIRSGGSVYEIIWDKDDIPSSPSSTDSPSAEEIPRKLSSIYSRPNESDTSSFKMADPEVNSVAKTIQALGNIAEWSWSTKQSKSIPKEIDTEAPVFPVMYEPRRSSSAATRRGRWSKSWGRDSRNGESGVESFPPLLERNSTFEWRKTPLVDINDSKAGRKKDDEANPANPEGVREGLVKGPRSPKEKHTVEEKRTDPLSANRRATISHAGMGIGTSSHHRRPSAVPYQRKRHSSLLDASKNVTRRTSQTTHSLSDMALHATTEHQDPPSARRLSRSTDCLPVTVSSLASFQPLPAEEPMTRVWRANSRGGLRIDTSGMLADSRVLRVAGLEEVAEDGVEFRP
ncbi:hypothetical protein MMC13_005860 [Lambiella insularis]|nr:hypothetical protein [Lambiella insularis]